MMMSIIIDLLKVGWGFFRARKREIMKIFNAFVDKFNADAGKLKDQADQYEKLKDKLKKKESSDENRGSS